MSVYFARCVDGMIKIGTSEHPWLRAMVHQKLELLAVVPGSYREEHAQHRRWLCFREKRWPNGSQRYDHFYPEAELLAYVAAIPTTTPEAAYEADIARRGRGRDRAMHLRMRGFGFISLSEVICKFYYLAQSIRTYVAKKRVRTRLVSGRTYVHQDDCSLLIAELTKRMKRNHPRKRGPDEPHPRPRIRPRKH